MLVVDVVIVGRRAKFKSPFLSSVTLPNALFTKSDVTKPLDERREGGRAKKKPTGEK